MNTARPLTSISLSGLGAASLAANCLAQSVPGFAVTTYGTASQPRLLSFAPDGTLKVGRDPACLGGAATVKVTSIPAGGGAGSEIGNLGTVDPDPVVVDAAGTMSGVPGSVLTAGLFPSATSGHLTAISPDGSVTPLFTSSQWINIAEMKFDHTNRLVFTAVESRSVWTSTGAEPQILVTLPGTAYPTYLTIGSDDRIYVIGTDRVVRIYAADGAVIDGDFTTLPEASTIELAPGGAFGTDLYAMGRDTGTLWRIDSRGNQTVVGTGFGVGACGVQDIAFNDDGDLFVSVWDAHAVLRVAPEGCRTNPDGDGDINDDGSVNATDLALLLGAWGTSECGMDLNGDSVVDAADLAILLGDWG